MSTRRLYAPVVLGTLAAGGLAFLAAGRTWAHVGVASQGLPGDTVSVTGSDAQPLVPALAIVLVTASLAILASSPRVRRGVGIFTVLVAVAGVLIVLLGSSSLDGAVRRAVEKSPAFTGGTGYTTHHSVWPYVSVVGFVLAAGLGVVTTRLGPVWPTMGTRYEAPGARAEAPETRSDTDMWKALDEGRDPTQ